jgi:hypothetical protein
MLQREKSRMKSQRILEGLLSFCSAAFAIAVLCVSVNFLLITQRAAHADDTLTEPDCTSYELALALAEGTEFAAQDNYFAASEALFDCQFGGGDCTQEEIDEALALGTLDAATANREAAENDLLDCQAGV